jgi:hypothetical protein
MSNQTPGLTVREMMRLGPCPDYTLSLVRNLWGDRERCTATDILRMDIPAKDRLWAVLREEFLSEKTLQIAACDFAEHVLPVYENRYSDNNAPRHCIEVKRRHIEGEATDKELWGAMTAAAAAAAAAYHAAYHAARAAYHAARAASAADAAACAAADYSAECEWQVAHLLEMIEGK